VSADDFVFSTLIANHPDPAAASRALAMAEAAVLRRAADALNALPQDYECDPGWGDAAERLRRTADGIEQGRDRPASGEKCSPVGAGATPDFFEPGHTYQRRRWQFQCLAVAPNPFNGEIRAVGFLYRPGEPATATALDPDDWAHGGWGDVSEGGEGR
jgi:hypothetical protein